MYHSICISLFSKLFLSYFPTVSYCVALLCEDVFRVVLQIDVLTSRKLIYSSKNLLDSMSQSTPFCNAYGNQLTTRKHPLAKDTFKTSAKFDLSSFASAYRCCIILSLCHVCTVVALPYWLDLLQVELCRAVESEVEHHLHPLNPGYFRYLVVHTQQQWNVYHCNIVAI